MLKIILTIAMTVFFVFAILAFFGWLTAWLWGIALVPQGLAAMTWTQGIALNILVAILFNGNQTVVTKATK